VDKPPRPRLTKRKSEVDRWADTRAMIERMLEDAQELLKNG